jgi:putative Mn2+ efflux pump MntP
LAVRSVVLFGLVVATLGAAHYLFVRRRRSEAPERPAVGGAARVPQSLFVLLLAVAWVASLGLAKPLAAFDHWIAFFLLGGIGWKMIHGVVRPGHADARLDPRLVYAVLILAALTSAQAFLVRFQWALAIVPVVVLFSAVAVIVCAPLLTRTGASERLRRIGQHRIEIAGGLILIGIALKVLIEHLA